MNRRGRDNPVDGDHPSTRTRLFVLYDDRVSVSVFVYVYIAAIMHSRARCASSTIGANEANAELGGKSIKEVRRRKASTAW